MIGIYSVQNSVAKTTCGLHVKSRTLKIKPHVHTINFIEIDRNLLEMIQAPFEVAAAFAKAAF